MTKERKIEILKDLLVQLSDSANILCTCEADERCEVVEECIKALEQQPSGVIGIVSPCKEQTTLAEKLRRIKQQSSDDCVSREKVWYMITGGKYPNEDYEQFIDRLVKELENMPPVTPTQSWIPVSERLPIDLEPVNITWVNHNPESYYENIKDKPFTATGIYFNGQWYWWTTSCADILAEYSCNYDEIIDDDIEIIAWQPLPPSYQGE